MNLSSILPGLVGDGVVCAVLISRHAGESARRAAARDTFETESSATLNSTVQHDQQ